MNNEYSVRDKLTLLLLSAGVICFGVIFPDSLSTHVKIVHFAAHFGMSFLLALSFYLICTLKLRVPKSFAYKLLIITTLFIGVIYKLWEISSQGAFGTSDFSVIIDRAGVMTSMSQNLSGLMAAMFVIESLLHKNLVFSMLNAENNLRVNSLGHIEDRQPQEPTPVVQLNKPSQLSAVGEN